MPLPTIFASLSAATGAQLDNNFAALGALTPIPCAAAGSNAVTLTPGANTPSIPAYANYALFNFVAAGSNTSAVTAQVGALAILPVYKSAATGPVALAGGEIAAGNLVSLVYDAALNAGAGGFHLLATSPELTVSGPPTSGQVAVWTGAAALEGVTATGTGSPVLATGPTLTGATIGAASFQTTTAYTVSTLPAASAPLRGSRAYVTDASVGTASVGAALVGGGSNVMPVFCNGSAWVYG